jgi:thymidylate synthase (FAD)
MNDQPGTPPVESTEAILSRPRASALDEILGRAWRVLDDGFVRVVDYMGNDSAIVQAARVSYGSGTKRIHEDAGLIRYLMRHSHTTPFEMCELKLHVRVPMDCWRQWIRHRTASVNEYSTRYSVAIDAAQRTPSTQWRRQSAENRQGSSAHFDSDTGTPLSAAEARLHVEARRVYEERLAVGVAREQARKDLPLSTYTEAYWKVDLHNLLHFLRLRLDPHAQFEIREYARVIGHEIVARWCPVAWQAFLDYSIQGLALSALETKVVALLAGGRPSEAAAALEAAGLLTTPLKRNRERDELEQKLHHLGLTPPWNCRA